jgi:hypothetical protein
MNKYENFNETSANKLKEINENEIIKENSLLLSENIERASIICEKADKIKENSLQFVENVYNIIY